MFKKLRVMLLAIFGVAAVGIGAGFSYWIYNESIDRTINSDTSVDDIKENYNFGKESPLTEYEIYFFPSTYYMYHYSEYFKYEKGDTSVDPRFQIAPENFFGHLEVNDTLDGFNIINPGNKNLGLEYSKVINTLGETTRNLKTYLGISDGKSEQNGSTWYYPERNNGKVLSHKQDSLFGRSTIDNSELSTDILNSRIGNPTEDYNYVPTSDNWIDINNPEHINRLTRGQKMNVDDRLGYWSELTSDEGRFLPIKLTFKGSLPSKQLDELIFTPRSDMADQRGWYQLRFSNWLYTDPTTNNFTSDYTLPNEGFAWSDKQYVFDPTNTLSKFARYDKKTNKHIIRLFPSFTIGKEYNHLSIPGAKRDPVRIDFETTSNSQAIQRQQYLTYEKGNQELVPFKTEFTYTTIWGNKETGYHNDTIEYAVANNFSVGLGSTLNSIKFNTTLVKNKDSSSLEYTTDWHEIKLETKYDNKYFESGVYNIYCVTTHNPYEGDGFSEGIWSKEKEPADKVFPRISKNLDTHVKEHPVLSKKSLIRVTPETNYLTIKESGKTTIRKAFHIYLEKVVDFKIIDELPVSETPVDGVYKVQSDINDYVNKVYDDKKPMFLSDSKLYKGGFTSNNFNPDDPIEPISNDYIYKIEGLDFLNVASTFLQFRINAQYYNNINIDLTPMKEGPDRVLYEVQEDSKHGPEHKWEVNLDQSNIYYNASEFFELVTLDQKAKDYTSTDPNATVPMLAFKLKNHGHGDDGKGIYNLLLVVEQGSGNSLVTFKAYVYRHKNTFLKVFDKEPTRYDSGEEKGFLNHKINDSNVNLGFFAKYATGVTPDLNGKKDFTSNDKNLISDYTFNEAIQEIVKKRENYQNDGLYNSNENIYFVVDHVSKRIVASVKFTSINDIKVIVTSDVRIIKNYVFYVESIEELRIRVKQNPKLAELVPMVEF